MPAGGATAGGRLPAHLLPSSPGAAVQETKLTAQKLTKEVVCIHEDVEVCGPSQPSAPAPQAAPATSSTGAAVLLGVVQLRWSAGHLGRGHVRAEGVVARGRPGKGLVDTASRTAPAGVTRLFFNSQSEFIGGQDDEFWQEGR